jgi:hypothetical protein
MAEVAEIQDEVGEILIDNNMTGDSMNTITEMTNFILQKPDSMKVLITSCIACTEKGLGHAFNPFMDDLQMNQINAITDEVDIFYGMYYRLSLSEIDEFWRVLYTGFHYGMFNGCSDSDMNKYWSALMLDEMDQVHD